MFKLARKAAAATLISGMLSVGVAGPAMAQQDGLVNVEVGDVTILENVAVGVAAQAAANICGVKVGPVAVLATQVDASGGQEVVCDADAGPLTQNVEITD
jgi:hypothetical protein